MMGLGRVGNRSEKGGHRDAPWSCLWLPFTTLQTQGKNALQFNLPSWSYSAVLEKTLNQLYREAEPSAAGDRTAGRSVVG